MRVDTRQPIQNAGGVASKARVEGGRGFSLDAAPASTSGANAPAAAATLAGLDAVLLLQGETETPQERRRRTAKRGHDLLDGLDRLKAAMLGGRVSPQDLRAIAGRLAERSASSGDPRLDGLMAEIELRAAVELAKLEGRRSA
ncbi:MULTISPECIES: flagellar assembly protein FliX [unclassified Methylobacterium]|uniref:flagellar assembly protein FliX n=1 Tax=unclassified Methylobacterium TaxID=2615210 RepID=UPI0011C1F131|nr:MULTISPECIES: flagellar assembly protein FliX [unclassified Methylobacterium]QEE40476.1 flagellar assembly protein fliX [Methylobacterium sp. WL1]TXN05499.1 flagellar assembly protein fliX [Methylobacterium sp. WL64]TXN59184.1 flagellar assembly protein fliX [Methylobacterium sp. WL2]